MKTKRMMVASAMMLVVLMGFSSCKWGETTAFGSGPQIAERRQLRGFEQIEINGYPHVYYTQADSFSVCVKGAKAAVEDILTEVDGKTLRIRNRGKFSVVNISFNDADAVAIYVTCPDLISVRLNGSGDFVCKQRLDTDNMEVALRGSGDVDIHDLLCDRCHVELIGSGDIDIDRLEAQEVSSVLIGSGDIEMKLQRVNATRLSLKGSGDVSAHFLEGCGSVDCDLRGSGDMSLKGTVRKFNHHKSGSGDIDITKLAIINKDKIN